MDRILVEYFRCPRLFARLVAQPPLSRREGFFTFGDDVVAYGRCSAAVPAASVDDGAPDLLSRVDFVGDAVALPFDLAAVVRNLRFEKYVDGGEESRVGRIAARALRATYYALRPMMVLPVRKRLQRARLRGWSRIAFPRWPVETSVDALMRRVLGLLLRTANDQRLPFVWFWPDGARAGAVMTHDVESAAGRNFCRELMDIDEAYGIRSSFQIVPEGRYDAPAGLLNTLRRRGFEVNVHDLNHDGHLFESRSEFLRRAEKINGYANAFHSDGFRSGAMYRNQEWYPALSFLYDMSVPNVAHLDPQRGGCCTVMPYFVGRILELPLTTIQDYSLFHILGDYSIELWRRQIEMIIRQNGLISMIAHPDYLIERRARIVYEELLAYLSTAGREGGVWIARPGELDAWWRRRSRMEIVRDRGRWRVVGKGAERARIAYAIADGDHLTYAVEPSGEART